MQQSPSSIIDPISTVADKVAKGQWSIGGWPILKHAPSPQPALPATPEGIARAVRWQACKKAAKCGPIDPTHPVLVEPKDTKHLGVWSISREASHQTCSLQPLSPTRPMAASNQFGLLRSLDAQESVYSCNVGKHLTSWRSAARANRPICWCFAQSTGACLAS